MRQSLPYLSLLLAAGAVAQSGSGLSESSLEKHKDATTLSHSFNPIIPAYWTGYPHHRRTPFAVSPDGGSAYLAYLDSSGTGVHIQKINPTTFAAVGAAVTISTGKEAGGLVAHNDGFAILTNEVSSSSGSTIPIPVIYRFKNGQQAWKTYIGGRNVDSDGANASPDINGDLVFSEKAGYYAAYIVVTAYEGWASGHFGDAIRYLDTDGNIKNIAGASSSWGCSHNTGIAFEAADSAPFASICAEDQGAIWLNTKGQGMSTAGVKISNEVTINGGSNEPMGGMGGSYSALARFIGQDSYIFSWVSRGAKDLTLNEWMGKGYTKSQKRTNNRNVAIALFSDKNTIVGQQATSQVGAADGDSQMRWVTEGSNDCSNAHAAAFDGSNALITWEEIQNPVCDFEAMGCKGQFAGTFYQLIDNKGQKIGSPVKSTDSFVAGDMVSMTDGRICWPYVSMTWDLSGPARSTSSTTKMSFACMSRGSGGSTTPSQSSSASSAASPTSPPAVSSTSANAGAEPTVPTTTDAVVAPSEPAAQPEDPAETTAVSSADEQVAEPTSIADSNLRAPPSHPLRDPGQHYHCR
ncbi:unnamed protein product [Parascedosporium putredinis]|uniref:Uncharacterized protein n=1 Tax=Parascedosporium putredinis TaxID=1442378 RepID=A0A9P1H5I0_9PEZI|nr:unnamed protein product [Parascedosporium putredinis]CAI7996375.1 unnamed protein product [Parascedosporium putredinis]